MFIIKNTFFCLSLLVLFSVSVYTQTPLKVDIAKKIEQATPKSLPQTTVVKRLTSDAHNEGLKGRVKSVFEEREGLTGIEKPIGKRFALIEYYDEEGNHLKRVLFEYRGKPYAVIVYGYIDNQRVSLSNSISDGNDFRTSSIEETATENKSKPDFRYELRYDYKYENGKMSEMQLFDNKGSESMRYIYKYKQNQMEKLGYSENGKLNTKYLYILDDKGNETARIDFDVRQPQISESNKFQYQKVTFDERGNWIRRTFSKLEVENEKEIYKPIAIEYRTITYHP